MIETCFEYELTTENHCDLVLTEEYIEDVKYRLIQKNMNEYLSGRHIFKPMMPVNKEDFLKLCDLGISLKEKINIFKKYVDFGLIQSGNYKLISEIGLDQQKENTQKKLREFKNSIEIQMLRNQKV